MFGSISKRPVINRGCKPGQIMLYHGSDQCVRRPELGHNPGYKTRDFGDGFYLTDDKGSAIAWAKRRGRGSRGYVTEFIFDLSASRSDGMTDEIKSPDLEWAEYIARNRIGMNVVSGPIVIGPTADNRMADLLNKFQEGDITFDGLVDLIRPEYTYSGDIMMQYAFKTTDSFKYLQYIKCYRVR